MLYIYSGSVRLSTGGVSTNLQAGGIALNPDGHDVAVLTLANPLNLTTNNHAAITLDSSNRGSRVGDNAIVTGWGHTETDADPVDILQEVAVILQSQAQCSDAYPGSISEDMLCAGLPGGGVDSCLGDSGGALVLGNIGHDQDRWCQVGVVSWGDGCAEPDAYGVYSRVWSSLDWIRQIAGLQRVERFDLTNLGAQMWFRTSDATSTPVVGDFDNDGHIDDIAYRGRCGPGGQDCIRVHKSNGTSFALENFGAQMWFRTSDATSTPVVGDFDNDGHIDDIAYHGYCGPCGATCWRVHHSNRSSFDVADYGDQAWFKWRDVRSRPITGDFDNDKQFDDLVYGGICGQNRTNCWRGHKRR